MNRVRMTGAASVVICLALVLSLGACYSRSALKKKQEEAAKAASVTTYTPSYAATPATTHTVVRRSPVPLDAPAEPVPVVTVEPTPSARPAPVVRPAPAAAAAGKGKRTSLRYGRPGFAVYEAESGRLWVFEDGSDDLQEFLDTGDPAKRVTRIGVGPDGKSLMSSDGQTIDSYLASTTYAYPGFHVEMLDGRLWVFKDGSEALKQYREIGEPAKRLTRIAAGPDDLTLIGPDAETLDDYAAVAVYGLPGFATFLIDGRLWVFRDPSSELDGFEKVGEPAKRVTRVGAGPRDLTLVGPDGETLDAYMAAFGG